MEIQEIIEKLKTSAGYFLTLTTRDGDKSENNLHHFVERKGFNKDDIIPSLDACVRSMGVELEKPVDVIKPAPIYEDRKPLKIAIISHFNSMPAYYSPARAVRNQIKILLEHGHDVTIFLQEGSKLTEQDLSGCKILKVIPKFKRVKMVVNEEVKDKLIKIFQDHLPSYSIAISHDFFIQDTVTFSEAIRQCGVDIPWLHFCRSGVAHDMNFSMPNARFVYLNYADVGRFAKAIKVPVEQCRVVPNEKEIFYMFNFHPVTRMIISKYKLWERDIIMTAGLCSTRLDAKGINEIIKVFVELKRLGKKVALIICNANGRRRVEELKSRQKYAKELGLNENEFIFTSLLANDEYKIESEVSNEIVAQLMQISNVMVMATKAEVSSNILLEAAMTKQLLVLNSDLPCLYDAVDRDVVLFYPFSSNISLHYSDRSQESLNKLAKQIIDKIDNNWADRQFRHVWRNYNSYSLYYNILEPILYERI